MSVSKRSTIGGVNSHEIFHPNPNQYGRRPLFNVISAFIETRVW